MVPLKPSKVPDKFLYVFFDMECTQNLQKRDGSSEHVSNVICAQQMCCECEAVDDLTVDLNNVVSVPTCSGNTPYANLLIISDSPDHSLIRFMLFLTALVDTTFLLRRFLELKLIMDCSKILNMSVENLHFLYSLSHLPMSLRSMTKSFDLLCKKGYYPHFFNTAFITNPCSNGQTLSGYERA